TYRTTRNEATRCNFCKNNCLRTFIDIKMSAFASASADASARPASAIAPAGPTGPEPKPVPVKFISKVPKAADEQRLIISTCEKGSVEDVNDMRGIKAGLDAVKKANPNFIEIAARDVWKARNPERVADALPSRTWTKAARVRTTLMERRASLRI